MVEAALPASRARITENGEALRIAVPARRDGLLLALLSLGVTLFIFVLVETLLHERKWFLIANLWLPVLYGLRLTYLWLWNAKGTEEITVSGGLFSVRYSAFGMGKTWGFEPGRMRDLRVAPDFVPLPVWPALLARLNWRKKRARRWEPNGIWQGPLAFDYGAKTYRFGAGMDEAEARDLLPHLLRRLSPDDPTLTETHSVDH